MAVKSLITLVLGQQVCHQVSISPAFYEQLLHQNPFTKKLQTQLVSTEKLCKWLLHKKAACKILVKLPPGLSHLNVARSVNFFHRHLRKIYWLMACTACFVCLISSAGGRSKNALGRGSASSGHITKLEQSRFSLDIYDFFMKWQR